MKIRTITLLLISLIIYTQTNLFADTWPRFRGKNQDGKSTETGLLKQWPANGPKMLWSFDGLGQGYGSPAVMTNAIYITGTIDKKEYLTALDLNGKVLWQKQYGNAWERSYPEGRTTPTVDGDRLYVMSGMGDLACFNSNDGKILWTVNMIERFQGQFHRWGIADSPVIYGDKVICTPGGPDVTMAALNKMTGETIWATSGLSDQSNYCTPLLIKHGGKNILISIVEKHFIGVNADNGQFLWQVPIKEALPKGRDINPNTPLYKDGKVYITSGYDAGSAMFQIAADGNSVKKLWEDSSLDVHHGGVVLVDGYLYGANWKNNRDGNWVCLDWNSGETKWEQEWNCKGSIFTAEGMLYIYDEKDGNLGLLKANPEKFDLVSTIKLPDGKGPYWAHPCIANGVLYVRHAGVLYTFDVKAR